MADKSINCRAVEAMYELASGIGDLTTLMEFGPFMMTDETKAEDFGLNVLRRLRDLRALALQRSKELAKAAGVPSPALLASLETSLDGAFLERPKGH